MRWMEEFKDYIIERMRLGRIVLEGEEIEFTKIVWWLGLKKRWGGVEETNLCRVILGFLLEKEIV